jgi:phenylacetic acid degradation operon negative regulatory protein
MTTAEGVCPAQCGGCTPERRAQVPHTSDAPCPTSQRLAQFRDESRGHAGSVIVTVFGDAVLPRGGHIWLGSLIALLAPLGLNDRLVRTSVFRLSQDDWLEATVHGRRSDYSLTPSGRRRFVDASRQIYAAASPPWDQRWRLITVTGSLDVAEREKLRRALFWHGFGEMGSDCFVHPSADLGAVFEALDGEGLDATLLKLLPLVAANPRLPASGDDASLVHRAWNLERMGAAYTTFVDTYRAILQQWQTGIGASASMGDDCAFLIRTLLIHDYRRLLLRDPQLPGVLLPTHWPGHEARALCRQLYQMLMTPSERHLDRHLQLASGDMPTATALLGERFERSDPLRV